MNNITESSCQRRQQLCMDSQLGLYQRLQQWLQLQALKALWAAVSAATGVPLDCPMQGDRMDTNTNERVKLGRFRGIVHHYHLTARKIDCAGLHIDELLQEMKDEKETE